MCLEYLKLSTAQQQSQHLPYSVARCSEGVLVAGAEGVSPSCQEIPAEPQIPLAPLGLPRGYKAGRGLGPAAYMCRDIFLLVLLQLHLKLVEY